MIRTRFVSITLAASVLFAGAAAIPATSAYALPHLGLHQHPTDAQETRVVMEVYNRGDLFRDLKIDGHVYTVLPHHSVSIKAPRGTPVFTNTTGSMHQKGDLLFSVDPSMQNRTLYID